MCDICYQEPCDIRCPNATRKINVECSHCGSEIVSDDIYIDNSGLAFCCSSCVFDYYGLTQINYCDLEEIMENRKDDEY